MSDARPSRVANAALMSEQYRNDATRAMLDDYAALRIAQAHNLMVEALRAIELSALLSRSDMHMWTVEAETLREMASA